MRLRVGVIGLGRRWRRYRPILAKLRPHIEVRAVCDEVGRRTEAEARQLRCAVAAGPVELLERPDVEALLLLDAQWFGLFALERACHSRKPVFCDLSLEDDPRADALRQSIHDSSLPVLMAAFGPVLAPATLHLRELLTHRLGPARLVRTQWCAAPSRSESPVDLLQSPAVPSLLAGCAWLLGDSPRSVVTLDGEGVPFVTLVLRFGADRLAQVTLWTAASGRPPGRFEVVAERGSATAEVPGPLRWRDDEGQHAQRLPTRSLEQSALERFLLALQAGQPLRPNFEDACQALAWQRAAVRSRAEGRRIEIGRMKDEG